MDRINSFPALLQETGETGPAPSGAVTAGPDISGANSAPNQIAVGSIFYGDRPTQGLVTAAGGPNATGRLPLTLGDYGARFRTAMRRPHQRLLTSTAMAVS